MDAHSVVIRPIITEQSMHFANARGAYSFEVHKKANKMQIRSAIQKLYNVKVVDVRTANVKGKVRKKGRSIGYTRSWKKAVVVLSEEHHIDLF